MEEYTCELLCLDSLFVSDNTDCFYLGIAEISFMPAPHIVEAEHNLELQSKSSINIMTYRNKSNSNFQYKMFEGINLVYYHDIIYVPQTFVNVF